MADLTRPRLRGRELYLLKRRALLRRLVSDQPAVLRARRTRQRRRAGASTPTPCRLRRSAIVQNPQARGYEGARATIKRRGYEILVTVGDQRSDLKGGHANKRYKVPNPMYFRP